MSTIVVPFHLDQRIDRFESPLGVDRTVAPELPSGGAWGRMAALYEDVAQAVSGDPAPIVVSGDCTTSIATVAGLAQAGDSPGIVWRDLDPAEDELLASAAVRRASVEGLRVDDLPAGPLYLHLDVDVADPADLPGLLFPVPDGPGRSELIAAVATVANSGRLAAVGVGLTWDADRPSASARADYVRAILEPLRRSSRPFLEASPGSLRAH